MENNGIFDNKEVSISVVVPVYNEEVLLPFCLDSLINQDFSKNYEIIIVDNGSTDKSREIAARYPVKIINEKEKGVAVARQRGFNEARGDIIASTDADTIPANDWLKQIDLYFSQCSSAAVTGSLSFIGKNKVICVILNIFNPLAFIFIRFILGNYLSGSNFAIKKDVFNKAGGFNTGLMINEDIDLARRFCKIGKIGYEQSIRAATSARKWEHSVSSFGGLRELWSTYFINFFSQVFSRKPRFNRFYDIRSKTEANGQSKD